MLLLAFTSTPYSPHTHTCYLPWYQVWWVYLGIKYGKYSVPTTPVSFLGIKYGEYSVLCQPHAIPLPPPAVIYIGIIMVSILP